MAFLHLAVDGLELDLSVRRATLREHLSELFTLAVIVRTQSPDVDLDACIFRPSVFVLDATWTWASHRGRRVYTGLCASVEQLEAEPSGLSTYLFTLVPRLWLLTLGRCHRIFQHVTIPDILTSLLDTGAIDHEWRIDRANFHRLSYKVQYGESDFVFLCRLCEEAGLTFFFESSDERGSVLVLSDAPCEGTTRSGGPLPFLDAPNETLGRAFVTQVRR